MRFSFFFALEIGKKEIQLLRLLRFVFRLLFLENPRRDFDLCGMWAIELSLRAA